MTRHACKTTLALLLLSLSAPALGQNTFMYTPRAAHPGEKTSPKDGVLVREIEVRKGDTLSGISRKFSGRGSYYPQILLFNDIKNPHRIHDGDLVRVPVSKTEPVEQHKHAATPPPAQQTKAKPTTSVSEIPLSDLKTTDGAPGKKAAKRSRGQRHRAMARSNRKKTSIASSSRQELPSSSTDPAFAQKQFNQALTSYRRKNWSVALEQFDRFLASTPSSPLAADASLYKADCYLKLSNQ